MARKVQVLLSAYNGERYIQQQIESVMEQSWREVSLLIRDDGSSDGTLKVIQRLAEQYQGRITWVQGGNLGVIGSFFELLKMSDETADYYCFCDQDDVWLPHKVESAVERLESSVNCRTPAMMFTSVQLVDEQLREKGIWPKPPRREPSFYNALYENIAIGATITFNKEAWHLCQQYSYPNPSRLLMHDWWFYIMISAFGHVIYDHKPSMLYRQHGGNLVGGSNTISGRLKNKWRSFKKHFGRDLLLQQAKEFHIIYGAQLSDDMKQELQQWIAPRSSLAERIRYSHHSKLYRQSGLENIWFKLMVLIGKL
ncbi:glycosyltransferase, group 2 family protein [Paenibacillus algicola]|uniref:Glycosyltransferase, group 2 family protein n=1 Tax=Paenibacillus algicola TaxID=2565926 RepID=A0A4P8XUJ4_9BACL|nr:glycosyltransferase family 2 protein [Paenibacillus algicola]QCT04489.1 glycosyltransferase, group 2 family protein [Paenibacillus algicola]